MTAAADRFRVLVLALEDPVAASVRSALAQAGLSDYRWDPPDPGEPGRPPVHPDMLILKADGLDVTRLLRHGQGEGWLGTGVPVVVLATRPVDRDERREWLRAGVWEVVRLPMDDELFGLQVRNFLRGRAAPSEQELEEEPYANNALLRVAEENLALANRHGRPLSAAAFGLDWGSRRADADAVALMQRLAATAHEAVRGSDLVGVTRRGALIVLLPDTDHPGADTFSDRMKPRLEARLRQWGVLARIIVGTAGVDSEDAMSAEDLLAAAEEAIG